MVSDPLPVMPSGADSERHSEPAPESALEANRSFGSVVRSPIRRIGPEALDAVNMVDTPDTLETMPGTVGPAPPAVAEEGISFTQPEPVPEAVPRQTQPGPTEDHVRPEQPTDMVAEQPAPGVSRAPIVRRTVTDTVAAPDDPAADSDGLAGDPADFVATTDDPEHFPVPVSEDFPPSSAEPDALAVDKEVVSEPQRDAQDEPSTDPDEKFRTLLSASRAAMMNGEFDIAVEGLGVLANHPDLSDALREEVLYDLGDALFGLHQDDLAENFGPIAQAYERAMNFNPTSRRRAMALRNLGVLHLRVNNLPEAQAYFNVLKRDHPHDPLVPTSEYYLGQFFLDRGDFDQAADHFQIVVQNHPEHSIAQQSSVGLARALNAMGYDEQAFQIMDFLEKRWPRYYIEEPELLELAGIIALRVNALEVAKQRLLTYYNLVPDTPDADMLLARIGDIYLLTGRPDPARRVFEKTAEMFPDQEGGLISKMRLVEGGIHDEPSLEDMFTTRRAADVYSEIISKHPDSPLAAVATIKLAIWQVWNKRLEDSLLVLSEFLESHPNHSLVPKALEVGKEAFTQLVERNAGDGRYPEILEQWHSNSFLHDLLDELSPETQLGLAMAYWNEGDLEQAITLARPYLQEDTPRQLQVSALELILGIFLEQQQWERIVDLEPLRDDLPEQQQRELTYSVALALENLNRPEAARPLWRGLAEDLGLSDAQRGYALYFLARNAMQEEQFERVYLYAQEALSLLLLEQEDPGKIRDAVTWLTQVTERTGRLQEALAWALELDQLIDRSDPDWSMTRYRLAQLHQRVHNHAEWQAVLEDLMAEDPRGLYGRLAASALQERDLEDSAGRFLQ